ncbi:hypothetical protein HK096_008844, partial [Nowakowskiella sp. JEL0078]
MFNGDACAIDFSTACSSTFISKQLKGYPLIALVDLQDDLSDTGCGVYSNRLNSSLRVSLSIQSAIVRLPSIYDSSKSNDIIDLKTLISDSKYPIYNINDDAYVRLISYTHDTVGALKTTSDSNSNLALVVNIMSEMITHTSSSTLQSLYIIMSISLLLLLSAVLCLQWRQRQNEQIRLTHERNQLELENFRQADEVISDQELKELVIKQISDLDLGVVDIQYDTSSKSESIIHREKIKKVGRLFQKSSNLISSKIVEKKSEMSVQKATNATCSICLESMMQNDSYRKLHCSHLFHTHCIDTWLLKRSRYCPLCRIDVVRGIHEFEDKDELNDGEIAD